MPFTFSHPAAVFPVISKRRFSQTGLLLGSIVPDLEFYFSLRLDENIGHKLSGILILDLPLALIIAFIFHIWVKKPLIQASPVWIQSRLAAKVNLNWMEYFKNNPFKISYSILLGVGSHLFLDSFTHADGLMVSIIPILAADLLLGSGSIPFYEFLQIALSTLGLIYLGYSFLKLEKESAVTSEKQPQLMFWFVTIFWALGLILLRTSLLPEFSSFWDVFMMVVGAMFYGVILTSIIWNWLRSLELGRHGQFNKLINTGGVNPGLERGILSVEQDKFSGVLSNGVMHVDHFIDESQVIVADISDIHVKSSSVTFKKFGKNFSQLFNATSFGFTTQFNLYSRLIKSLYRKIMVTNVHYIQNLREYINTRLHLVRITGLIFFLSFSALAQEVSNPITPESRERHIQEASKLRGLEQFSQAISHLDSILLANPKDAQILLFKGDLLLQNQQFSDAVSVYEELIPLNYESTITRVNMSYALFMDKKPSKALDAAKEAWAKDQKNKSAVVNHFNALLWNVRTGEAKEFLEANKELVDEDQYLVMNARLWTTSGNYKKGLSFYDSLVHKFPKSFYIQEYAEVLIGKKQWEKAAQLMEASQDSLSVSQKQKISGLLGQSSLQYAGVEGGYFEDVAGNIRMEQSVFWQNEANSDLQVGLKLGANQVSAPEGQTTKSNFFAINLGYRWSQSLETKALLIGQQVKPDNGDSFRGVTGKLETNYQPNDRRMIGVFYSSDLLNFTADLLGKNIRSQNLGMVTHIMLNGKTGVFAQSSYGMLNDGNSRMQFFGSIYRVIRTEPTLKTGLNFSALSFSNSETNLYFAPKQFLSTEVFVDYSTPLPLISKLALKVQGAAGIQKIENKAWESAFRTQVELNYRLADFDFGLNGQFSNVASASGTGYRFHYVTLRVSKKF